ncbi:MAG: DUF5050 domain-containing protein [Roseburia sp.]|nr:DUF5050 domain-containing protein [Roseburia sp.]
MNSASEEKPVYNIPSSWEEKEINPDTGETNSNETENASLGNADSDKEDSEIEELLGEALFADFKGVGKHETGSTNTSDFMHNAMSSIVCSDKQGTIYYVNYGTYEDNYIYSYRDGKRELLVDKICNFVNLYERSLYFLVSETPPDSLAFSWGGKLYRYDLDTKDTELLLDEKVCNLYVSDGVMYFCDELRADKDEKTSGNEWYSMKIGDAMPEKMGRLLPFFYGDYQLAYSNGDNWITGLVLTDGKEDIPVINETYLRIYSYTIVGGKLWISFRTEENIPAVAAVNLADGTHKIYPGTYTSARKSMGNVGYPFAIIDDRIYAQAGSMIVAYDESQGYFDILMFDQTMYEGLYTDGEYLYGLAFYGELYGQRTNAIVRIKPNAAQITLDSNLREVISE